MHLPSGKRKREDIFDITDADDVSEGLPPKMPKVEQPVSASGSSGSSSVTHEGDLVMIVSSLDCMETLCAKQQYA